MDRRAPGGRVEYDGHPAAPAFRAPQALHQPGQREIPANFLNDGYKNIQELSAQFGVRPAMLTRFAMSGVVDVVRAQKAGKSPVRMSVAEVFPAIAQLPDAIGPIRAAGLLGLPVHLLPALAERRLIERLDGRIRGFMKQKDGYKRSSIENLLARIRQRARTPLPAHAIRMSRAVRVLGPVPAPWGAIISAIVEGDLEVYAYPATRMNVRHHLAVLDLPSFEHGVTKHMSSMDLSDQIEWIGASTASEILKVTEIFVYRLVEYRPDLLKRKREGQTPFRLIDVQTIARDYIFVPEICQRSGAHAGAVCRLLRERGFEQPINLQGNKGFGFRRQEVEKFLVEQEGLHTQRLAELEQAPDNERTRLIRAVETGTSIRVAAKNFGFSYGSAVACIKRWRNTGDWSMGKGGTPSPLDQHTEWLRSFIAKNPGISLPELIRTLKKKRRLTVAGVSVRRWLDRHNIALARRRRPPSSTGTPLMAAE